MSWAIRGRGAVVAAALVAGAALAGCDQPRGAVFGVGVENKTPLDLHFSVLLDQGWYTPVAHALPHQSAMILDSAILPVSGCTAGGMIAYAEDGREISRHDAPLCAGDRWVVDISSATPSGGGSSSAVPSS